jgi:hypothetical protein
MAQLADVDCLTSGFTTLVRIDLGLRTVRGNHVTRERVHAHELPEDRGDRLVRLEPFAIEDVVERGREPCFLEGDDG